MNHSAMKIVKYLRYLELKTKKYSKDIPKQLSVPSTLHPNKLSPTANDGACQPIFI